MAKNYRASGRDRPTADRASRARSVRASHVLSEVIKYEHFNGSFDKLQHCERRIEVCINREGVDEQPIGIKLNVEADDLRAGGELV